MEETVASLAHVPLLERLEGPGQVHAPVFELFYTRIRAGRLSLEQVKMAPELRQTDHVANSTDPELRALLEQVWLSS